MRAAFTNAPLTPAPSTSSGQALSHGGERERSAMRHVPVCRGRLEPALSEAEGCRPA